MAGDKYARDLAVVPPKGNLRVVVSDPDLDALPDGDPAKESKVVHIQDIRAGVTVVLSQANSPLAVLPGQTVYVDTTGATGPLVALLPTTAPTTQDPITFLPMGSYATTNLHIDPATLNVAGAAGEIIEVTTDNVAFEVRYINTAYGWGFFSLGSTYLSQQVTVNASDLVSIRYEAGTLIQLVTSDRERAVASTGDVDGVIRLPNANDVTEGWQSTFFQEGNGKFTFQLATDAVGETIVALGDQLTSLGKGAMVTILLLAGKKWLIGGGLTGV